MKTQSVFAPKISFHAGLVEKKIIPQLFFLIVLGDFQTKYRSLFCSDESLILYFNIMF